MKEAITSRISPRTSSLSLDTDAKHAEEYLQGLCQNLSHQGLETGKIVLRGDVFSKLLETLQNEKIDLLVMATHGHNVIDARWEGSLTPRFLPNAPVPVLLVRGTRILS
jgi:nucleotide-binding universal stress UspA family protein